MPFIRIDIASKLSKEQKALLAEKITEAVGSVTQAPAHVTYVIINELEHEDIAVGGTLLADRA
ncbi:tautomerase family protein [Geotalea sp. SG265]|uniref:tautomerase family protein n=1 Tax=Geotalea sp. SG265 TaxID=2922867 RepID=UPI001FAF7F0C|nr:tautomerase family protein [Geotalea sp. SG265]